MSCRHGRFITPIVHALPPSILPRGDGLTLDVEKVADMPRERLKAGGWQTMLLQLRQVNPSSSLQRSISSAVG